MLAQRVGTGSKMASSHMHRTIAVLRYILWFLLEWLGHINWITWSRRPALLAEHEPKKEKPAKSQLSFGQNRWCLFFQIANKCVLISVIANKMEPSPLKLRIKLCLLYANGIEYKNSIPPAWVDHLYQPDQEILLVSPYKQYYCSFHHFIHEYSYLIKVQGYS